MAPMILLALCALANHARVQATTVRIALAGDVDEVTFNPSKVSVVEVRHWMQLSPYVGPYSGYLIPEDIELCDADDPRYQGCGKEQGGVNFHNARLNIGKIRKRLHDLNGNNYPSDLSQVVLYAKRIQTLGLWIDTQLLTFVGTKDSAVLRSKFGKIDPSVTCGSVLDRIAKAKGEAEASRLARFDWMNCVWLEGMKEIGPYPQDAWQSFLSAHHIREHFMQEEVVN